MPFRRVSKYALRFKHMKIQRMYRKVLHSKQDASATLAELGLECGPPNKSVTSDPNSFHRAISSTLLIAQIFGIMPVRGVTGKYAASLRFQWWSARVIYSVALLLLASFWNSFWISQIILSSISIDLFTTALFYGTTITTVLLFYQLGRRWPGLVLKIHHIELAMKRIYGYPSTMTRKLRILTAVTLSLAFAEHALSIQKDLYYSYLCSDNLSERMRIYFVGQHYAIFQLLPYSHWTGISLFILDTYSTFVWNYMDLFVMGISIMVTERLKQLNRRLLSVKNKVLRVSFWRELREDFARLTIMVYLIDDHINKIVLLSFGNNLFFICLQLFKSIQPTQDGGNETPYRYYFSFGYLLLRSAAVCIMAANINEESKKPYKTLCSVPSESYCDEVERFMDHVQGADIALTGFKFFSITRRLLLTVVGTIVTYEVVVVQMTGVPEAIAQASQKNGTLYQKQNPLCREKLLD